MIQPLCNHYGRVQVLTYGRSVSRPPQLVTTREAARSLSVSVQTLQRWVREGLVVPAATTAGGHHRFDIEELRQQVTKIARDRRES